MYQPEKTHIKKATGKNRQPRQPLGVLSDNVVQLQETRQVQTRKLHQLTLPKNNSTSYAMKRSFEAVDTDEDEFVLKETIAEGNILNP